MIKITDQTIPLINNDKIEDIFKEYRVEQWFWKENKYSYSLITVNQELQGEGIFPWGKISNVRIKWSQLNKYLLNKTSILDFEETMKENKERIDFDKFKASMWIDIETWEHLDVDLIEQVHTAIVGWTWSWKSVCLSNILYQMLKNKYTELYIIDKVDFASLEDTKKVKYRKPYSKLTNKDIVSFLNYFFIEYARRQDIFQKYWVPNWSAYEKKRLNNPEMPKLNFIFVIIDEYQSLRKQFWTAWKVEVLDLLMKQLMDTVRSTWIIFYYWTQDYKVSEIWPIHSSIITTYSWKVNYHVGMNSEDLHIVKTCIPKTRLFYDHERKKLLKIPYSPHTDELLKREANNEENIFSPIEHFDNLPEMLNDSLSKVESDIFSNIDLFMKELGIKDLYIDRLKKSSEYIPFCILFFAIFRIFREKKIIGKNTDIFSNIDTFDKELDALLFSQNIDFYKDNKKLVKSIEEVMEFWQDEEEFVEAFWDVMNNYLWTVLWNTSFIPKAGLEINTDKQIEEEKEEEKKNDNELINISYTWEIKPTSFNSMYYVEKGSWNIRKTQEAIQYEKTIKNKVVSKMTAQQLAQTKSPVILDIEFTLWLPVKKDWELSKVWRNDLDNLLKATIDWINNTIIKDDVQVFWIRTKLHYIEKQNNFHKNNKVKIKVVKLNQDTFNEYKNKFNEETKHTPVLDIPIKNWIWISIPSVNNMYFIWNDWKKKSSSNTLKYKRYISSYINQYKERWHIKTTGDDLLLFLTFSIKNPQERDLDNMLKATIDAMQDIVFDNDKQIREIVCFKNKLEDIETYEWRIKLAMFKYNILKDIKTDNNENDTDFFIPVETKSIDKNDIKQKDIIDNNQSLNIDNIQQNTITVSDNNINVENKINNEISHNKEEAPNIKDTNNVDNKDEIFFNENIYSEDEDSFIDFNEDDEDLFSVEDTYKEIKL